MATFTVTNLFDSGTGSLRQAIFNANAQAGADKIFFNAGLNNGTINLTSGELLIADDLTINGLGADLLTVDAGGLSRVFNIDDGVSDSFIDVLIDGLTITGGKAPSIPFQDDGGGIFSLENLAVTNSIISGNNAAVGGGIFIVGDGNSLKVSNSIISGNSAVSGGAIYGVGQLFYMVDDSGGVEVSNSIISNNNGGGIVSESSNLTVTNSIISGNVGDGIKVSTFLPYLDGIPDGRVENTTISGNSGNGIFNDGINLEVTQSTISGNSGDGITNAGYARFANYLYGFTILTDSNVSENLGRGIDNGGNMEVSNSTISSNSSGGIYNNSVGATRFGLVTGHLTVKNSIILENKTDSNGGGIFTGYGKLDIANSTISSNEAVGNGGGIHISPRFQYSEAEVKNSTISGNVASGSGGGAYIGFTGDGTAVTNSTISGNVALGSGGGIVHIPHPYYNFPFPVINNTIIAGNNGTHPDVEGDFNSNDFNLIGDTTGSTGFENDLIEPDITKILDTTLEDNGGSTLTHALVSGSPAIDAGNNNRVSVGLTTDQRGIGFNRIVDGNNDTIAIIDIGAFEVQPSSSTSVPEPSSIIGLFGLMILGTGSLLRRKRQNKP